MALSRLANLNNDPTGAKLYVDPNNFDATDGVENRGTSPNRPFISIARAVLESAVFSYQPGRNNDRNDRTTILLAPAVHYIDNRPGFSVENINGAAVFKKRTGPDTWTVVTLDPFGENTNFDSFDSNNDLYKYNSVNGGLILPKGTSIKAIDPRKTKIRPLYVPDPTDSTVESSSIFNLTGGCYLNKVTFFDADISKFSYKNYSDSRSVPTYSHHKLVTAVFADGVNPVRLGATQTNLTDLQMYYYKLTRAYNSLSGRNIEDYPSNLDFEPSVEEYRIVGPLQDNLIGISSIRAGNGNGTGDNSIITVTTADLQSKSEIPHNFSVDTQITIRGITESTTAYNGTFTVREVVGINTFTYVTTILPAEVLPAPSSFDIATVSVESDTVSSSSPYVAECSLKSTKGMCGMIADGSKATGFRSMVVKEYTGISLQNDDNAYLIYDNGVYYDNITLPSSSKLRPLYQNSRAIYKPEYENFHIKVTNNAFVQAVSVFAIGYAEQFVSESGGDIRITNANSNFGANALSSLGFKAEAFSRDDTGYITHIIPPKELSSVENQISWVSLDIPKTQSVADAKKLYLYSYNDINVLPNYKLEGYKIGARVSAKLFLTESQITYSSPIYMATPNGQEGLVARKEYTISRSGNLNNISTSNIITLTQNHNLFSGENLRLFSDTGQVFDGVASDTLYYAITNTVDNTLSSNQIKLALSLSDAQSNIPILGLTRSGGVITIVSSVTDKIPGDFGHPIQWDSVNLQWYLNTASTSINEIYTKILTYDVSTFGNETPVTYINRISELRSIDDSIYKLRYVIPKEFISARPPQLGYIIQESDNVAITTASVSEASPILNSTELRNDRVIVGVSAAGTVSGSQLVTVTTELPHRFVPGDIVKLNNIRSTNNSSGIGIVSTYNGSYSVLDTPSSRIFTYRLDGLKINPGSFTNLVDSRTTRQQRDGIPSVSRQSYKEKFYIYDIDEIKSYIPGTQGQDGVYHLTIIKSSVGISPNVGYGLSNKYFSQDIRNLYPQIDRDNAVSDPNPAVSFADLSIIGKVATDNKKNSITLESLIDYLQNTKVGFGITNITLSGLGNTTLTLFTDVEHKLNSIKSVNFLTVGAGYGINSTFYSRELLDLKFSEENPTCKVSTDGSGQIIPSSFRLVDAGTGHTVGEQLGVLGGIPSNAVLEITDINNNIGDSLQILGATPASINDVYEILSVPSKKSIVLYSPSGISTYSRNTNGKLPIGVIGGPGVGINSMTLSNISVGLATVVTRASHGFVVGNKFKFTRSDLSFYDNKNFVVSSGVGTTTFSINVGVATTTRTPVSGTLLKYAVSSNDLPVGKSEENLVSRGNVFYSGAVTTLGAALVKNTNLETTITVTNFTTFVQGDYISINNEILRVSRYPNTNQIYVIRGQLGTPRTDAISGTLVKKIEVIPTELRRPSFLFASGHTFDYVGWGPGNYSTALPQRQDRVLSETEVFLAQTRKEQGGLIVYDGINDSGDSFTGGKKVSSTTGKETIVESPILTYTGDDVDSTSSSRQTGVYDEILVRNRITVEGGENNDQSSQFYGPASFNRRLTNLSSEGILARNISLRSVSNSTDKLFTVGISTPTTNTLANPKSGYVSYELDPINVNHIGYVYKGNTWRPWGPISIEPNQLSLRVDKLGIGVNPTNSFRLNVVGSAQIDNLVVTGNVSFSQAVTLSDVNFEDIYINKTAYFSGVSTDYSQIHQTGTSKLNQLEVVGVSTFNNNVFIQKVLPNDPNVVLFSNSIETNNIRVGMANSNTIDTKFGSLVLTSNNNNTLVSSNLTLSSDLSLSSGNVAITSIRSSGVATAYVTNASIVRLGVGNTNQNSYLDLNNDSRVFSDFGLRLIRNSGIGSVGSELIHRGSGSLNLNTIDNGSDIRLLTGNTERVRVGSSGTVTVFQNSSGVNTKGGHLRLTQAGTGDVVLSWDITNANANRRWYAGIDTSDGYSWKLASPTTIVPYGNENFDIDTKIKVEPSGATSIYNTLSIGGSSYINNTLGLGTTSSGGSNFGKLSVLSLGSDSYGSFEGPNGVSYLRFAVTGTGTIGYLGQGSALGSGSASGLALRSQGAFNLFTNGSNLRATFDNTTLNLFSNSLTAGAITGTSFIGGEISGSRLNISGNSVLTGITTVSSASGIFAQKFTTLSPQSGTLNSILTYKFLRSDGTQDFVTSREVTSALGFIPANIASVSGDAPVGNSLVCDDISSGFNNSSTDFNLRINGVNFIPAGGPANLLVSLGGVIKQPGTDYVIVMTGQNNTNIIRFTVAPLAATSCFIIALGGQGSISSNVDWNAKGDLFIGSADNSAIRLTVGANRNILTADSTQPSGVKWDFPGGPLGSVGYVANSYEYSPFSGGANLRDYGFSAVIQYAPPGYLICNGGDIPINGVCQGVDAILLQELRVLLRGTYGRNGQLPNLLAYYPVIAPSSLGGVSPYTGQMIPIIRY